jgi:ferredoxin--NADP+ reductase
MSTETSTLRAAVVGAGPAGFYTADQLLTAGFEVDLIDSLPTPFGLVRSGVAPDHPKIKSVARVYEKTAGREGFRFFGGIQLGRDLTREQLRARYHAVVYAIGTPDDNRLGIPGEDRPGSHSATRFVAWYNGHPEASEHEFDLDVERAVVIGNGNVAIDVARMLVLHPEELAATDTADHAIAALSDAKVSEVVLLGRRGPAQAAFTNPELRELSELQHAGVIVDATDLELDEATARWLEEEADATSKRNVDMLRAYAANDPKHSSCRIVLRFLRSPVEILGAGSDGPVTGVRVVANRIEPADDGSLRAVATDREETIDCGLVLRAVGYRGRPIAGLPFDERRGLIRNSGGRVCDEAGAHHAGEYVVGWIKRGPSGVIGTNKKDAADTIAKVLEDRDAGLLPEPGEADAQATGAWLATLAEDVVTWEGWQAIDHHERSRGELLGRPRVKLVSLRHLFDAGRVDPSHQFRRSPPSDSNR